MQSSAPVLKVGVTGGIGSGKTMVCKIFELLGVPVFYADEAARLLVNTSAALRDAVTGLFGKGIYVSGELDRAAVAAMVFDNPEKLAALNALVHPATLNAAKEWISIQKAPYAIKEAAIFFESGTDGEMDIMVGISAPLETRILRIMDRNKMSREEALARIARQMDEAEKMSRCDFVIINDESKALIPQVLGLHNRLLEWATKKNSL